MLDAREETLSALRRLARGRRGAGARRPARPRRRCSASSQVRPVQHVPAHDLGTAREGRALHADPGAGAARSRSTSEYRWQRYSQTAPTARTSAAQRLGTTQDYVSARPTSVGQSRRRDRVELGRPEHGRLVPEARRDRRCQRPANTVAVDLGRGAARLDADRQPGRLDRPGADHVHVPVVALRPVRRQVLASSAAR